MIGLGRAETPLVWLPNQSPGCFTAALPPGAAGRWCRVTACVAGPAAWWGKLEMTDPARGQVVREAFLGPRGRRGARSLLLHVPRAASGLTLRIFRAGPCGPATPLASLRELGRAGAAWSLLRHGWRLVPGALAGAAAGRLGRLRVVLGQAPARAGEAPPYPVWCALYESWGQAERTALQDLSTGAPKVGVLILGADGPGRAESLASVAAQWRAPEWIVCVADGAGWAGGDAEWTLVLRAGDVLAPHALACLALEAGRRPDAALIYADTDQAGPDGRTAPSLKPGPDDRLLRAAFLTRGACLLRRGVPADGVAAERAGRVPFVLTHLARCHAPRAESSGCGRVGGVLPFVSIVIPTSLRSRHVLGCLRRVCTTDYAGGFEVVLAVSRIDPADRLQAARLARAARLPNVRVLKLALPAFNYAQVNNLAVAQATGTAIVLLNDDVAPIRQDWLAKMMSIGSTADGRCTRIVGARLLYGNGQVQHGGVIMGLAHLCEHAFRLARDNDAGPHGLALLDREVSAVTGACLLVGRDLYQSLGGMDESFAIALNDVDFCLRARRAGVRVVFAAGVTLHHYEGLSLGRHYAGARAELEAVEVRRLRARWAGVIANDPFYHPGASLEPGREFQPGFPPRITPVSWMLGDPPAHV